VEAFLARDIKFIDISRTIEVVLGVTVESHPETIDQVLEVDREAREAAKLHVIRHSSKMMPIASNKAG
jgi:1-deoxy-D-xylulose 5-phosphate reductoisomerase